MRISVGDIPNFITASNPKALRRAMLKLQTALGYGVKFFDIQQSGKKWVAWYYDGESITPHNAEEKLSE